MRQLIYHRCMSKPDDAYIMFGFNLLDKDILALLPDNTTEVFYKICGNTTFLYFLNNSTSKDYPYDRITVED